MSIEHPENLTIEQEEKMFEDYLDGSIDKEELQVKLGLSDEALEDYINVAVGVKEREDGEPLELL